MTKLDALKKAESPIANVANNPNAYEIPFEQANSAKSLVGNTYKAPNGHTISVEQWIGQNYLVRIDADNYDAMPVVYLLSKINLFTKI